LPLSVVIVVIIVIVNVIIIIFVYLKKPCVKPHNAQYEKKYDIKVNMAIKQH